MGILEQGGFWQKYFVILFQEAFNSLGPHLSTAHAHIGPPIYFLDFNLQKCPTQTSTQIYTLGYNCIVWIGCRKYAIIIICYVCYKYEGSTKWSPQIKAGLEFQAVFLFKIILQLESKKENMKFSTRL